MNFPYYFLSFKIAFAASSHLINCSLNINRQKKKSSLQSHKKYYSQWNLCFIVYIPLSWYTCPCVILLSSNTVLNYTMSTLQRFHKTQQGSFSLSKSISDNDNYFTLLLFFSAFSLATVKFTAWLPQKAYASRLTYGILFYWTATFILKCWQGEPWIVENDKIN